MSEQGYIDAVTGDGAEAQQASSAPLPVRRYLSRDEAATWLGVSVDTFNRFGIPYVDFGPRCKRWDVVDNLVRGLLTPLTTRTLEANDHDLPTYAEAAPEEFLSILEQDLKSDELASIGLMRPAASDLFGGGCARTGLLWALEGLAWNPATLPRTALILAQLAEVEIDDNWSNKPIASLESIFRAWMPQTAADHDQRLAVMNLLAEKFSNVAWRVCVAQFDSGPVWDTTVTNHAGAPMRMVLVNHSPHGPRSLPSCAK